MKENQSLCTAGKEFIKKLLSFKYQIKTDEIQKVNAYRQKKNIDIWAEVNEEYVIIIEDKVNTSEHDNQLERYEKAVKENYENNIKIVYIYLKIGLESSDNIDAIKKKGWNYISRKDFLDFLQSQNPQSEIYSEYLSNLLELQKESESFTKYDKLNSWEATKGLYSYIENYLGDDWKNWDYVSNPRGGFLGMWFHFTPLASNQKCELYLQIENNLNGKINLFIKIGGEWERNINSLYNIFGVIQDNSKKMDLSISKPAKYQIGRYTSVAIINDVFVEKENEDLDLENLIKKLDSAIVLIDTVDSLL